MSTEKQHAHSKKGALNIGHSKPFKRPRRAVRTALQRRNVSVRHLTPLHVYTHVDELAQSLFPRLDQSMTKAQALRQLRHMIRSLHYSVVEAIEDKPWGGMYRFDDRQSERFVAEFFPGMTLFEAKLGRDDVRLSPKIILLEPGKRVSWQYHNRRAERWHFLTDGLYETSYGDIEPKVKKATPGTIVQIDSQERHRVCGAGPTQYTLVAEIWQHIDRADPSDESDIVRLADDYSRITTDDAAADGGTRAASTLK